MKLKKQRALERTAESNVSGYGLGRLLGNTAAFVSLFGIALYLFTHFFHLGQLHKFGLQVAQFPLPSEQIPAAGAMFMLSAVSSAMRNWLLAFFLFAYFFACALFAIVLVRLLRSKKYHIQRQHRTLVAWFQDKEEYVVALIAGSAVATTLISLPLILIVAFGMPYLLGRNVANDLLNKSSECTTAGKKIADYTCSKVRFANSRETLGIVLAQSATHIAILSYEDKTQEKRVEIVDSKNVQISIPF